jgi:hypothetical protein
LLAFRDPVWVSRRVTIEEPIVNVRLANPDFQTFRPACDLMSNPLHDPA